MQLKDEELVAKYIESQDYQYLTELFTRHSGLLYRSAFRIMKNASDAEDVLQIAYIKMIPSLSKFKNTGSIIGWMLQIIINTCYEKLRSEKSRLNRERKVMSEKAQITIPKNYELTDTIEAHLSKLPEIYKAPIILRIMEGLTIKEVSDALKMPEKTIRSQISRGLEKLKESLKGAGITASVSLISKSIESIQKTSAPEIYTSKEYFNQLYQKQSSLSAKIMATALPKNALTFKIISASLLTITLVSIFSFLHHSKKTSMPSMQQWDFENTTKLKNYMNFRLLNGIISVVDSLGVNQSNALKIAENSIIEIDISAYQLPIRISYVTDNIAATTNKNQGFLQTIIKNNYNHNHKVIQISGVRGNISKEENTVKEKNKNAILGYFGHWFSVDAYIDQDSVDCFITGKRAYYLKGSSLDNKKLYLLLNKNTLIDDFKIESIDPKMLPDKKAYIDACLKNSQAKEDEYIPIPKEELNIPPENQVKPYLRVLKPSFFSLTESADKESIPPSLNTYHRIQWERQRHKAYKKWDFTKQDEIKNLHVAQGKATISTLGVDNSNCMEVETNTVLEIDTSRYQLPLKISYQINAKLPPPGETSKGIVVFKDHYEENRNIFHFIKFFPPRIVPYQQIKSDKNGYEGKWLWAVFYITEDSVATIYNDTIATLVIGKSISNHKLYIRYYENHLIDNIIIETVDTKDIPDYSAYKKYTDTLSFEKGAKDYSPLKKETQPLYLDKKSTLELGIFDKEFVETTLGLQ